MNYVNPDAIVSTQWLADHLKAPDVRVVDASWYPPSANRNGREEYDAEHIPGAVYFDINDVADSDTALPHMLPAPEKFASKVRKMGLGNGNKIVVYDGTGFGSAAARVWWMFRVFGHRDVCVLDGGLPKWLREQRATEDLPPIPRDRHFIPHVNQTLVRDYAHMLANVETKREQIVDARAAGRFKGTDAEPWPVKRIGHMPGALNVPVQSLIDDRERTMKPAAELQAIFDAAGVDMNQPVAATCGSGVTACVVALGLYLMGHKDVAVYDGSWSEWGNVEGAPVELG